MAGRRWTREEDLAVLYLRHRGMKRFDPVIAHLAEAMERTEASIWMRKGNFDSLDPSVPGVGLRSAAQLTKRVWAEYHQDQRRVLSEARGAYLSLLNSHPSNSIEETPRTLDVTPDHGLRSNNEEERQETRSSNADRSTRGGLMNWLRSLFSTEPRS